MSKLVQAQAVVHTRCLGFCRKHKQAFTCFTASDVAHRQQMSLGPEQGLQQQDVEAGFAL